MTQLQSDENINSDSNKKTNAKRFADLWIGIFFLLSSVSLLILMLMFILVWQPIWTEGFKDFHTISTAIDKLDKTAKPASDAIPLMLVQMNQINKHMYQMNTTMLEMKRMSSTMHEMQNTMQDMNVSVGNIEEMTPEIKRMTMVLSTEMPRLSYTIGRVNNKMPNMDFMPFN